MNCTTPWALLFLSIALLFVSLAAGQDSRAAEYRSIDGSGNNLGMPTTGMANTPFNRKGQAPWDRAVLEPSPRKISNMFFQGTPVPGELYNFTLLPISKTPVTTKQASMFRESAAQFFSHDVNRMVTGGGFPVNVFLEPGDNLYLYPCGPNNPYPPPLCFDAATATPQGLPPCGFIAPGIPSPPPPYCYPNGDPAQWSPNFLTTSSLVRNGNDVYNSVTGWFDLSTVYGSDPAVTHALRLNYTAGDGSVMDGGLLYTEGMCFRVNVPLDPANPTGPVVLDPATGEPLLVCASPPHEDLPPSAETTGLGSTPPAIQKPGWEVTAGDDRINNNYVLALQHTLWLRNHNRLARELKARNPSWDDETLFQEARRRNIAYYQKIVFEDYVPIVLGPKVGKEGQQGKIPEYTGYKPDVNGATSLDFDIAFRYGHSTINDWVIRRDDGCEQSNFFPTPVGVIETAVLQNAGQMAGPFGFPSTISGAGDLGNFFTSPPSPPVRPFGEGFSNGIIGAVTTPADESDRFISFTLRELGFFSGITPAFAGRGIDLGMIDIIRERQAGAPSYLEFRHKYWDAYGPAGQAEIYGKEGCDANEFSPGPDPIGCFTAITGTEDAQAADILRYIYGKISQIDAIVGLLAEPILENDRENSVGPTLSGVLLAEYIAKRDGDRFYYKNDGFTAAELAEIEATTYRDIMLLNGVESENLPEDVFSVPPEDSPLYTCTPSL